MIVDELKIGVTIDKTICEFGPLISYFQDNRFIFRKFKIRYKSGIKDSQIMTCFN